MDWMSLQTLSEMEASTHQAGWKLYRKKLGPQLLQPEPCFKYTTTLTALMQTTSYLLLYFFFFLNRCLKFPGLYKLALNFL